MSMVKIEKVKIATVMQRTVFGFVFLGIRFGRIIDRSLEPLDSLIRSEPEIHFMSIVSDVSMLKSIW